MLEILKLMSWTLFFGALVVVVFAWRYFFKQTINSDDRKVAKIIAIVVTVLAVLLVGYDIFESYRASHQEDDSSTPSYDQIDSGKQ